jgi:hypothetical protein
VLGVDNAYEIDKEENIMTGKCNGYVAKIQRKPKSEKGKEANLTEKQRSILHKQSLLPLLE